MAKRVLFSVVGFVALALVASACSLGTNVTGGGNTTSSLDSTKKSTFGFQSRCDPNTGAFKGEVQWSDQGTNSTYPKGVNFHASVSGTSTGGCTAQVPFGLYTGTYDAQQPKGTGGTVYFTYYDSGSQGHDPGDAVALLLSGGVLSGYSAVVSVANGNIVSH